MAARKPGVAATTKPGVAATTEPDAVATTKLDAAVTTQPDAAATSKPDVRPRTGAALETDSPLQFPHYETVALVLQGGGALGSYQAGVYEGLDEAGVVPGWIAGISIGALNTAIIAGNAPGRRVAALKEFWNTICQPASSPPIWPFFEQTLFNTNDEVRKMFARWSATSALLEGQKGFFVPRFPPPMGSVPTDPRKVSYYDTTPLKATLERLCDFDRINSGETRVSVGAVNVGTGNFVYFDNTKMTLRAEHFMASGALPPGFAAVEIDGEYYWDGGLVSNTPLSEVLQTTPRRDTLAFQVDLWSAVGDVPTTMGAINERAKDIQYSSRTRMVTDVLSRSQLFRKAMREVLEKVPEDVRKTDRWCVLAEELACSKRYNVVHLIYHDKEYETDFRDFQFGTPTMLEHWKSGLDDIRHTLRQPGWLDLPDNGTGFVTHDIHRRNE